MGTRAELYIRVKDKRYVSMTALWRHYDGYPDYVVEQLREFINWFREKYSGQHHWLLMPETVASELIYYEGMKKSEYAREYEDETLRNLLSRPDWRPLLGYHNFTHRMEKGKLIEDAEYIYIMNIEVDGNDIVVNIKGYRHGELREEEIREVFEKGRLAGEKPVVDETIRVKPVQSIVVLGP